MSLVNGRAAGRRWWVALAGVAAVSLAAKPTGPSVVVAEPSGAQSPPGAMSVAPYQKEVAALVADMIEKHHYLKVPIDDRVSEAWLDLFIDNLDWSRTIFLQSDIDEFSKFRTVLDDDLRAKPPRLDVALTIYSRYVQRVRERYTYGIELLANPLDLTNAELLVVDRHEAELPWPATTAAANELWRQRTEDEVIASLIGDETPDPEAEIRERMSKRYDRSLKNLDDQETTDVLELWLSAFTETYDPHSVWFKPARNDDFDIEITNSVQGIGAQLSLKDDFTTVSDVVPGGPAFKDARLKKDDRILMVGQGAEEAVDVVGLRLDKVVKLIRGAKGTRVALHVEHADGSRELIELVRDQVMLEDSAAEGRVEEVDGRKLGVVDLPSFYVDPSGRKGGRRASEDVRRELMELEAEGVEGVILDLRGNGGGSLVEAIDVAGLFLPGGPVVQIRSRDGRIEAMHDVDPGMAWSGPLVVMTDATSASASEIVAGALQDYGRALIVGDASTHGKGSVQQVAQLTPMLRGSYDDDVGGALKITLQKFYRVSGGSTQNKGVEADVVLPSFWDGLDVHEGDQEHAMPWDQIPPAPHVSTGDVAPLLAELRQRSEARRGASEDYQRLGRTLELRAAQEGDPDVSLVLSERQAEFAAQKAKIGMPDEPEVDETTLTAEQRKARARELDFPLDEGLAVLADYLALR
ncbi:MAG: carboxy terminal-processing peptidase [Myxococcota bacterium]